MPNWTRNTIEISGKTDDVKQFLETVTQTDTNGEVFYTLTSCFPKPTELDNIHQGHRNIDGISCDVWYEDEDGVRPMLDLVKNELIAKYGTYKPVDWEYRFWGTKWGDCETELANDVITSDGTREITMTFDSAWGEPFMLLNDIANKYNLNIINTFSIEFEEGPYTTVYPWTPEETQEVYSKHRTGLDSLESI